ncbi:hypothetical protein [Pseudohoeflea coraliihabitans]|uniref:Uncharacterized protein n=1 Tax=Pseudohoeflea coraliihabitans TaxID=2860393 RepID=A0ABS6WLK3_9HYPH|nr:hypothetical protein [Pseudohoeflea sp. DP4N28-3]MBW3096836.1 hypothetical protein [Pseudohoeflea sp. DP4N28-3]
MEMTAEAKEMADRAWITISGALDAINVCLEQDDPSTLRMIIVIACTRMNRLSIENRDLASFVRLVADEVENIAEIERQTRNGHPPEVFMKAERALDAISRQLDLADAHTEGNA